MDIQLFTISDRLMYNHHQLGYVTLLSVLVVGAIGSAITVSVLLLGLDASRTSFSLDQSNQAKAIANACAEEAMEQIRSSSSFTGTASLTLGNSSCSYTVSNTGGETRTVAVNATVGTIVRRLSISVTTINPSIIIASWQET